VFPCSLQFRDLFLASTGDPETCSLTLTSTLAHNGEPLD
jgi:hypothetical protein